MKHPSEMQLQLFGLRGDMAVDLDLLASHLRSKMQEEQVSLRKAADLMKCSPATLSRLLDGSDSGYQPDTATLTAAANWIGKNLSSFEPMNKPQRNSSSLAEVEMYMNALPNIDADDAKAMMAVVRALYEERRKQKSKNQ